LAQTSKTAVVKDILEKGNHGGKGERRKGERRKEKGEMRKTVRGIYPDGALPLFIGGGDRLGGEGVQNKRVERSEE